MQQIQRVLCYSFLILKESFCVIYDELTFRYGILIYLCYNNNDERTMFLSFSDLAIFTDKQSFRR